MPGAVPAAVVEQRAVELEGRARHALLLVDREVGVRVGLGEPRLVSLSSTGSVGLLRKRIEQQQKERAGALSG